MQSLHLLAVAALALVGCGSIDPEQIAKQKICRDKMGTDYLPFGDGFEWKYAVSEPATDLPRGEKTNTILQQDGASITLQIGGEVKPGVRWLQHTGSRYEWLRNVYVDPKTNEQISDQYYYPPALRFDASKTEQDETWDEEPYTKTSIDIALCPDWQEELGKDNLDICPDEAIKVETVNETWTVRWVDAKVSDVKNELEQRSDSVGVPAGNYPVLCHQRACADATCNSGTYCFAKGVGKVYELSSEREELSDTCF